MEREDGSGWENVPMGILREMILSQDFHLSRVERSSPPMVWPRMLMSQGKGTEFDCVSHGTENRLLCLEGHPYQLGNVC